MAHEDAPGVAAIYNEGIRGRGATFQTRERAPGDVAPWAGEGDRWPILVAERDGTVIAWARASRYSDFEKYSGVGEVGIYVTAGARGSGIGGELLDALAVAARDRGFWKLIAKVFPQNESSIALFRRCGYRGVGTHLRHGQLDGEWKDVLLMELSLE